MHLILNYKVLPPFLLYFLSSLVGGNGASDLHLKNKQTKTFYRANKLQKLHPGDCFRAGSQEAAEHGSNIRDTKH